MFGVTGLLAGRTRLSGWKREFSTFAPKRWFSVSHDDGAIIHGFWKADFDNAFYLFAVKEIKGGMLRGTDRRAFLSSPSPSDPPQDMAEYRAIDREWIDEQAQNPFTAKANTHLNTVVEANATLASYMEEASFYRSIDDIVEYAEIAKTHGTKLPWDYQHSKKRVTWYQFNATSKTPPFPMALGYLIERYLEQPHTLLFVHFKDEQDVLSQAQSEFLNMLTFYIHDDHEPLNIKIMTVLIRDGQGTCPYEKEFHEYFSQNMLGQAKSRYRGDPTPFIMVFGNPPKEAFAQQTAFVRRQGNRLLDFDLFHGCRDQLAEKPRCNFSADRIFRKNLRQAMHEVRYCAGLIANSALTTPKDYRGLPKAYVEDALWRLEQNAVVIKIHTEEKDIAQMATTLCNHLKSSGCPYVTVVLADGQEDIIEVHDDTDMYSEFPGAHGRESMFWSLEQEVRKRYMSHKLNGASPFMITPGNSGKKKDLEKTPEIFFRIRKSFH